MSQYLQRLGILKMKKILLLLVLIILLSFNLYAESSFYGEIGYTPSLIDFIWTESTPDNHTLKRSLLGIDFTSEYFPKGRFGIGQETQWRGIDKITIKSGSTKYTLNDLQGNYYFLHFSPLFLYAPIKEETYMISLGFGPSFSMGYFLSEPARNFKDFYVGTTMKIRYRYLLTDFFYISAGWSLTIDFVYFGNFNEKVFKDFIQIQNSPVIGFGYHR
jgi:hypothetical protein